MHVINDWYRFFVDPERKRTNALCNTKTAIHNAGIPGITKPNGKWCGPCVRVLSNALVEHDTAPYEVVYLTHVVATETHRLLRKEYSGPNYLPLWHESNRSFNNPRYLAWSTLLDRCYNPAHPDHSDRWHQFEVAEEWFDFDNFIRDAQPDENITAILPKAGGGLVIGPENHIIMSRGGH